MIPDRIDPCPLSQLPPPLAVHRRMGTILRELRLLRRLLRLSQEARQERTSERPMTQEGRPHVA